MILLKLLEANDVNITLQYFFQQVFSAVLPLECEGRTIGALLFSGQEVVCEDSELWTHEAFNHIAVAFKVNHLTGMPWNLALPNNGFPPHSTNNMLPTALMVGV